MIIIVGAGAAGLAMARELQQRGLDYRVLEKAGVGETWAHHYDQLRLHTLKDVSALPGLAMPQGYPRFPDAAQVRDYLQLYARHFQLNISAGMAVHGAIWDGARWRLDTSDGMLEAETLVVTTGIWSTPVIPPFDGLASFRGATLHANAFRNAAPFAGQRVLVVGVGNSGAEIAVELSAVAAATRIVVRAGAAFIPRPESALLAEGGPKLLRALPTRAAEALFRKSWGDFRDIGLPWPNVPALEAYPVVGFDLPEAVRAGRVQVRGEIGRFTPAGVTFAAGPSEDYDAVIFATGYRPTLDFVQRDQLMPDARGWPTLDQYWRSTANSHLICLGFAYPATEGWLQSIGRFAREAAEGMLLPAK